MIPDLVLILCLYERVEDSLPLGHLGRHVFKATVLEEVAYLRTSEATFCIGKYPARGLKVLSVKWWDSFHVLWLTTKLSRA